MRVSRNLAAILIVLLFVLAGCGKDLLDGTVTSKQVDPGYTFVYMMPIVHNSGSSTYTTYIPITYWVPTCYKIVVRADDASDKDASGDTCLSEAQWEATKVGDHYEGADVNARDRKVKR